MLTKIIDNEENIIDAGTIGNIAVSLKPHPPVGLFSGYNVCAYGIGHSPYCLINTL